MNRPWALVVLIAAGMGAGLVPPGAAATTSPAEPAAKTTPGAAAVLRVGVVEGSAPCSVRRAAPATVGQDNADVYGALLGLDSAALADLHARGVV